MHHHPTSSWTTLPQPFYHHTTTFNHVLPYPTGDHNPLSSLSSHSASSLSDHQPGFLSVQPGSDMCGSIHTETNKMTTQLRMVDSKTLAASKSHSEAEKRRRERINNHLTKLRTLLPNTTKTDKASLLAEVIQHVKELKCQTSIIAKQVSVPSEKDELTIDNTFDEEGRIVIKASLCCEDRSDLMRDLAKTLKMLRLRTLKAEITTLGRRVKNVLFVTGDEDHHYLHHSTSSNQMANHHGIDAIEEALKAIVEKTNDGDDDDSSFGSIKRQKNK